VTSSVPVLKEKSLRRRLVWGFVLCVGLIWFTIVGWGFYTVLTGGSAEIERDANAYGRQIMVAVRAFRDQPVKLAEALAQIEAVDREPDSDGEFDDFHIQLWIDSELHKTRPGFPQQVPEHNAFDSASVAGAEWLHSSIVDAETGTAVTLWLEEGTRASLSSEDMFFFVLPLFFSLPVLLLPAWFMTRIGLRPLGEVVDEISERVESGALTPLSRTRYRELNPVIDATNRLMGRLNGQLKRERGFVADVAHELKTPMAILQSNVGIIKTSDSQERHDAAVNDLGAGIDRSNHLISQLLRMARMEQGADSVVVKRDMDLAEFLRERVVQAEPLASSRGLTLEVNAPQSCQLNVDADAVAAVIDNLLDNAIKYSHSGGQVTVSLDCEFAPGKLMLRVVDQGQGIDAADRDRAFTRFARLNEDDGKTAPSGAGLGLSIVYQALDRLEGSIALADGDDGKGLAVNVTLPALHVDRAAGKPAA